MVSKYRALLALVVVYTVFEILVDNVLVFLNLTGRRIPSVTLLVLDAFGIEFAVTDSGPLTTLAFLFGTVGLLFVLGAVRQLVGG